MKKNTVDSKNADDEKSMYNKAVGMVFESLRLQRKLSRRKLAELSGACSAKTIERIEKGMCALTDHVLTRALPYLGVFKHEFYNMVEGREIPTSFKNDFDEIWQLCFKRKFQDALANLETLKSKDYCNTSNPKINQAILLCESLLEVNIHNNHNGCLYTLYNALRITSPLIISPDNEINYKQVSQHAYTLNEYRILNLIATSLDETNRRNPAIRILTAACKSLEAKKIDSEIRRKLLPTVYYNLSNFYINEGEHKKAFNICEKGIEFCKSENNHKIFAKLLYNRAKSLNSMGNKQEATNGFKHSHNTFLAHEDYENANLVKEIVAKKYQIHL